jgi:tetratricopeptide (TPR) repeat protein
VTLRVGGAVAALFLSLLSEDISSQSPRTAGLGRISFPTSGPAAAQPAFERGVLLLHNFEYDEAILAFREAQRLAPGFAMAYWGEALAYSQPLWYNEEPGRAREVLARLGPSREARAAKAPTPREKGYLDAAEVLFGSGDRAARHRAYADRMAALVKMFPEDDEAATLFALALLGTIPEGARKPDVSLRAGDLAVAVLKRNPQHPGAAHYALHAFDDGLNNRKGLEAARIYAKMAPASSHALHMPSHVFLPLGMWNEAVAADEASFAASAAWVQRTGRSLAEQDFHSLSWLHYEYLQQGRFADARKLFEPIKIALAAKPAGAGMRAPAGGHTHSEIDRGFDAAALQSEMASMRARAVVESGAWSEMRGQASFGNIDELFAVGMSGIKLGEPARGVAAIEHLEKAIATIPDPSAREVANIMADELMGLLDVAMGDSKAGLAALARAAEREAKQPRPIARPYPIKPASELYGDALLAAGDAKAAVAQYRRALERTPRRAASLLGLARAAQKAGLPAEAARAAKELLDVWQRADPRPELTEMRSIAKSQ